MLDQIPFSTFSKLSFDVGEPEDLLICGGLEYYDRSYDRITPNNSRLLERFKNRNFFKSTCCRRLKSLPIPIFELKLNKMKQKPKSRLPKLLGSTIIGSLK